MSLFTEIKKIVGEDTYNRGDFYYRQGKVLHCQVESGGHLYAEVSGSYGTTYFLSISMEFGWEGRLSYLDGDCTCPAEYNCKHVVAALLASLHGSPNSSLKRELSPQPGVLEWLDKSPKQILISEDSRSLPVTAPRPGSDRLFYIIRNGSSGQGEIIPFKAYVKKNGGFGVNTHEYNYTYSRSGSKPAFLDIEDVGILAKLEHYQRYAGYKYISNFPTGDELIVFLREVVETGRARGQELGGPVLSWSEPRKASVTWLRNKDGSQSVAFIDQVDPSISFLRFPLPIYIDPASGSIGLAEMDLDERTLAWVSSAPTILPESTESVARRLGELGSPVPLPKVWQTEVLHDLDPVPTLTLYGETVRDNYDYHPPGRKHIRDALSSTVYPCARLAFSYGSFKDTVRLNSGSDTFRCVDKDSISIVHRNRWMERSFQETLLDEGELYGGKNPRVYAHRARSPRQLNDADIIFPIASDQEYGDPEAGIRFAVEVVPELRQEGWNVDIDPTWPFHLHDGPVTFSTSLESSREGGTDWFKFSLKLEADGQEVEFVPLILAVIESLPLNELGALRDGEDLQSLLSGSSYYMALPNGSHVVVEGERIVPFVEAFLEAQGLFGFHVAEATRAAELATALEGSGVRWKGGREILELGERLRALSNAPETEPPVSVKGELRPYQKSGYGWLRALSDSGFGGALSDDMGLGKTIQALALLAHIHLERNADRPSLLIVPTSLIGNWQREAGRFTPDLKILVLHGPDRRSLFARIPEYHLVISTYPLIVRDHGYLFEHEFELAVLDEAQNVKNPAAATSKRIREIRARHRLAMTGTPMENNLEELWALYDWLIPGLLGNRKAFKNTYRTPIEQKGDGAKQRLLSTRIKPFLMRRSKDQVADDLPSKTIMDELVPLEGDQRTLYESIRAVMDERVRRAVQTKGIAGSRITIIDALLKLRQVCCDPRLVKLDAARKVSVSAKRTRLLQLLTELEAEGRKVLVFSQFVEMLRLLESDLRSRGWKYAMLHGKTKDREREISSFQDGDVQIFLMSLKVGGVGLNLTAADTVILYDPWWNPATELQAMDRAHRIGQDKPVFVHRMIAEGTVETAIQQMQKRKQALSDALFEGTGDGPLSLTEEDIRSLFAPVAE